MRDEGNTDRLNRLWEAYRLATPEPEAAVNFMPQLWGRIDAARPVSWAMPLARLAARLLPLAAAATLAMGAYVWSPRFNTSSTTAISVPGGYVDVLAGDMIDQQRHALYMAGTEDSI
ncbi:MAG TPA: hypothetical protein VEU62_11220 [Bryobacterales bacterium]|nr:hypothetical protein [Bryobacterales bacterium]